jgi:hypothetical protein
MGDESPPAPPDSHPKAFRVEREPQALIVNGPAAANLQEGPVAGSRLVGCQAKGVQSKDRLFRLTLVHAWHTFDDPSTVCAIQERKP